MKPLKAAMFRRSRLLQALKMESLGLDRFREVVASSRHSDRKPRLEIRDGPPPGPWIRASRCHSSSGAHARETRTYREEVVMVEYRGNTPKVDPAGLADVQKHFGVKTK